MKVGLLCGREYSFPPAFLDRVNTQGRAHGISAEFVTLAGTKMGEPPGYRDQRGRLRREEVGLAKINHSVFRHVYFAQCDYLILLRIAARNDSGESLTSSIW